MSDYQLMETEAEGVIRVIDNSYIPNDSANKDWIEYQQWLADGGVPDPYMPPAPVPPTPTGEQSTLYDHENRLRKIEGQPPMKLGDFIAKMQ